MANKVTMIVDKNNLQITFECTGDIWKWLTKSKQNCKVSNVLGFVQGNEVKKFIYEPQMENFIKMYKDIVNEVQYAGA